MRMDDIKQEIIDVAGRLYEKNLNGGYGGNLSIRVNDLIYITRGGIPKVNLSPKDIAIIDINGNFIEGKPSSEYKMHLYTYQKNADLKAMVHAHPPYAMGFSIGPTNIPTHLFPETSMLIGKIAISPFFPSGTNELAEDISNRIAEGAIAVLMEKHGISVVSTTSLWDAYYKLEAIEHVAMAWVTHKILKEAR
ncbi:fuculose phosphate aldolase [bacterium 3DAC]|nr:fuculose phosphate aldolase [bacterium 3DAC]